MTVEQLQKDIDQWIHEYGVRYFDELTNLGVLMEEVGELAKSIRKISGMKFTDTTSVKELKDEIADVQIVLLGIASMNNIDVFDSVIEKEKINQGRKWK